MQVDTDFESSIRDVYVEAAYNRDGNGPLIYTNGEGSHQVEEGLYPTTLWHGKFLKHKRFFQPPDGKPVDIDFTYEGKDNKVKGCHRFAAKSVSDDGQEGEFHLWYTAQGKPCHMEFSSAIGTLRYVVE